VTRGVVRAVAQAWADRVTEHLQKGVEAILAAGRAMLDAKAELEHGEWERMFQDHPNAVARPIPMSHNSGTVYMKIASHPILSKGDHGHLLPPSWRTLYELTKVPEKRLERAIERGLVTPDLERKDVKLLMPPKRAPAEPSQESNTLSASSGEPTPWTTVRDGLAQALDGYLAVEDENVETQTAQVRTLWGEARRHTD